MSSLSTDLSRLLTRLVYLLERERGYHTFCHRTDGRTDGQATGQMERGTRLLAPWEGRRMGRRAVGEMGGGTTTAELSSLVHVYFSRDYKRS